MLLHGLVDKIFNSLLQNFFAARHIWMHFSLAELMFPIGLPIFFSLDEQFISIGP
jgi:hypothetical protein